jgi:hypothetical protein
MAEMVGFQSDFEATWVYQKEDLFEEKSWGFDLESSTVSWRATKNSQRKILKFAENFQIGGEIIKFKNHIKVSKNLVNCPWFSVIQAS